LHPVCRLVTISVSGERAVRYGEAVGYGYGEISAEPVDVPLEVRREVRPILLPYSGMLHTPGIPWRPKQLHSFQSAEQATALDYKLPDEPEMQDGWSSIGLLLEGIERQMMAGRSLKPTRLNRARRY